MATSKLKTPLYPEDLTGQNTTGIFKFYKYGRVVYCSIYANNVSATDVTISGSTIHKIMDLPSGFEPLYTDAEVRDTFSNKRIVFDKANNIVHCPDGITSMILRGGITYFSAS